jgi:hypothetical protein
MRKKVLGFAMGLGCLLLSSCATTSTLYSWNDYEDASYSYSKTPTDKHKAELIRQFEKMSKQTGTRQVVPPGYYAEYGFLLVKDGKKDEGIAMLKKEIELYPESALYINRIIEQLQK